MYFLESRALKIVANWEIFDDNNQILNGLLLLRINPSHVGEFFFESELNRAGTEEKFIFQISFRILSHGIEYFRKH